MTKEIGTKLDRKFRNDINQNFKELDGRINSWIQSEPPINEVIDARDGKGSLFNKIKEVESLALSANGVVDGERLSSNSVNSSRLKTSSDSDKIGLNNLKEEVLQAMAGTTPIGAVPGSGSVTEDKFSTGSVSIRALGSKSVTTKKLDDKAITETKISFPAVVRNKSKNLVDTNTLKAGVYVAYNTGTEVANVNYNATEFIPVLPSTVYTFTKPDQLAFYDDNKTYISGIGSISSNPFYTFTTPANAAFIKLTIHNNIKTDVQLELGSFATKKEAFVRTTAIETLINKDKLTDLLSHVKNPFVKTKVKLVGDSITAGVGGTGYSKTGEVMFTDHQSVVQNANVLTAKCWANSLVNYLQSFSKEVLVDLKHPEIKLGSFDANYSTFGYPTTNGFQYVFPNKQAGSTMVEFSFFGTELTFILAKSVAYGIFDVYVDGVLKQSVDAYSSSFLTGQEVRISGLTESKHTVKLLETNTKNSSATGTEIYLQGVKLTKHVKVKNWGISGKDSNYLYLNKEKFVESDDDFIISQMGTNDRIRQPDGITRSHQIEFVNYVRSLNKKVILMASLPASANDETPSATRNFKMYEVHNKLQEIAHELDVPFISNYNFVVDFITFTGRTIDSLLSDGLHPNDEGYNLMFRNILKALGFGYDIHGSF